MCGIVGLHLRTPGLYPRLGELLTGMLCQMDERGSDSAGVAVYGDPLWSPPGSATVTVPVSDVSAGAVGARVNVQLNTQPGTTIATVLTVGDAFVIQAPVSPPALVTAVRAALPGTLVTGFGDDVTVLKGVGHPRELATRFGLEQAQGWQGVGHTRMATESAVTLTGCHPYTVGPDQCLVHNGSFANHATIRRQLRARGVQFDSENDTEVGARYVAQALAEGLDVETALKQLCIEFDGFYTMLVSDRDSFAVVRDAIACKPAVIAETTDWVAMASEYRALVGLPGIETAEIYEPEPERVYVWTR